MKKLIAKLLVGIFSLALYVNLSAEEWKSYKFKQTNKHEVTEFSDDIITLEKGDEAKFVNLIGNTNNYSALKFKIWLDEETSHEFTIWPTENKSRHGLLTLLQNFQSIYGPCKLQIGAYTYSEATTRWVLCNVKITRAHESQGRNVTGYSLVLPESTDTNYNLVLESSTDLVSWTADTTGTKMPSDKKRFYRLRAVKE
jgi:hypothetical protein